MAFLTEELLRPVVGTILRRDPCRHAFLCYGCVLALTLAQLGGVNKDYEVRRTMDRIFREPGSLLYKHSFPCEKCKESRACLGAK
jgi:hypothetical protein